MLGNECLWLKQTTNNFLAVYPAIGLFLVLMIETKIKRQSHLIIDLITISWYIIHVERISNSIKANVIEDAHENK